MSKPTVRIHNVETDEIIDREMTDSEYEQYLKEVENHKILQEEIRQKEVAKAALLARLGITAEEATTLLS
jgi:lipoate synthase